MEKLVLRDNDYKFLEVVFKNIRTIDQDAIFNILNFPTTIRVEIQSKEEYRGLIFNKLHHLHRIFGLQFNSTQFIKRDKNIISFDLKVSL